MIKKNYGIWTNERCCEQAYRAGRFRTVRPSAALPHTKLSRVIEHLKSAAHPIADAVLRWRDRRNAIRTLEALSDHYLLDVGIERSDIPSIVTKARNRSEHPR